MIKFPKFECNFPQCCPYGISYKFLINKNPEIYY